VTAVALGFEVAGRIGKSLNMTTEYTPELGVRIKKNAGMSWMVFGAVVAAAKLLGLDEAQTCRAFGLAASSASLPIAGQWAHYSKNRPMTKWAFPGPMAEAGLMAAMMAKKGFLSDPVVLDHDCGFWRMTGASEYRPGELFRDLGQVWAVEETSLKPYPACRYTNGPLDALYRIIEEAMPRLEDIEEVRVFVCGRAQAFADYELGNQVDAGFNFPHLFAMALLGVEPGPQWHLRLDDPVAKGLGRKVKVMPYPEADQRIASQLKGDDVSRVPHRVELVTRGGTFSAGGDFARGDHAPSGMQLSDAEVETKFARFSSGLLKSSSVHRMIELSRAFEAAAHVSELVDCLY
jgi:2-methylcitrate dehydratase PrpD